MLENGFLSTGDLVKILGTTKNTLFHYDSMGLFSPAMVKENGYRAYSYRQMETFRAISSLRQLGMSLSEIKDYMQNRNPERLNQLLHTQLLGIQEEIKKLRQIEKFLHHHIQSLAELKALDLDSITIEEQPEQTLYCSLPVNVEDEKSTLCHLGKFFSESIYFKTLGAILSTAVTAVSSAPSIRKKNLWNGWKPNPKAAISSVITMAIIPPSQKLIFACWNLPRKTSYP